MRRAFLAGATVSVLAIAGCGTEEAPPPADPTTTAEAATGTDSGPVREEFDAANKTAPWFGSVTSVKLDGRAVVVVTSLTEAETDTALAVCEAAYSAGQTAAVDMASVAVRTADDSSLAWRNIAAGHTACQLA